MALFTDGPANALDDLLAHDSGVLETARVEGIDLGVKLKLAWEELGIELKRYLAQRGKGELELRNVVATEPVRKCHAFRALALAYQDAAHRQRNDRYRERGKEWERQAVWAWEALLDTGIGIVERPVRRATRPLVELTPAAAPAATYYVQIAWVNRWGAEGAPSELVVISTSEGQGLSVTPEKAPEEAEGWNVYLGYAGEATKKQNGARLEPGQTWRQPAGELTEGPAPSGGQNADYHIGRSGIYPQGGESWPEAPGLLWRG